MTKRFICTLFSLLSAGLGTALYLTHHFYAVREGRAGFASLCHLGERFNCDAVTVSRYAELFAGFPLAGLAVVAYLAMFALAVTALVQESKRPLLIQGLFVLSSVSAAFTVVTFALMIFSLKTFCLFCLLLDGVNLMLLALLASKVWGQKREWPGTIRVVAMNGVMAAIVGIPVALSFQSAESMSVSEMSEIARDLSVRAKIEVPISPDALVLGDPAAPVTIVEFSDLQCPHCRMGALRMETLLERFPGKVRVVLKNFPLDAQCNEKIPAGAGHKAACEAASAVVCAQSLGKGRAAYEHLFDKQAEIQPQKTESLLQDILGADVEKWKTCLAAEKTKALIHTDIQDGIRLGIQATPTFFMNGRRIEGVYPLPVWVELIENELKAVSNVGR